MSTLWKICLLLHSQKIRSVFPRNAPKSIIFKCVFYLFYIKPKLFTLCSLYCPSFEFCRPYLILWFLICLFFFLFIVRHTLPFVSFFILFEKPTQKMCVCYPYAHIPQSHCILTLFVTDEMKWIIKVWFTLTTSFNTRKITGSKHNALTLHYDNEIRLFDLMLIPRRSHTNRVLFIIVRLNLGYLLCDYYENLQSNRLICRFINLSKKYFVVSQIRISKIKSGQVCSNDLKYLVYITNIFSWSKRSEKCLPIFYTITKIWW